MVGDRLPAGDADVWHHRQTIAALLHDLRHAIRLLRTNPGFSLVAMATIALAIGANAAMFSFVNGAMLRPLPYPDAHRIVSVLERAPGGGSNSIATLNYLDWASQNAVFEYIAAEATWRPTLSARGEPVVIPGVRVSPRYFDIFGVQPARGRMFHADEDQPGRDDVVLLSHALWQSRFAGDPGILEQTLILNGAPHRVVGILPAGGPFDRAVAQIWKPLTFQPANATRDFRWLGATAKLKDGVSVRSAQVGMDLLAERLSGAYPDSNKGWGVAVEPLADVIVGPGFHAAITMLFAATLFVLLIGCVNLANLTLARSLAREGEMSVRAALGAAPGRLRQQVLVESLVVSICGGVLGAGVGYGILKWIQMLIPSNALPPAVEIRMDVVVLLFTLIVAVATGLLIALAASRRSAASSLVSALRTGSTGTTTGQPGRRARGTLVIVEVALAFVLLVGSGLLMKSLFNLRGIDPGFDATNVLTAGVPLTPEQHPDAAALTTYLASIRDAVAGVPGVDDTAFTSVLPLQGRGFGTRYAIGGREPADRTTRRLAFLKMVSPSYASALGIALRAGRMLRDEDTASAPPVVVINETLARREFGDKDPIGQRVLVRDVIAGRAELGPEVAREIVGVIADEKTTGIGDETGAGLYVSHAQSPTYAPSLIVRASVPPLSLQQALRAAVARVNSQQALSDIRTLDEIVSQSTLGNRVVSLVLLAFAAMALTLAAVGIYGVVSVTAAQRSREMGIRAALGAGSRQLRALIFYDGMKLAAMGLVIGLAATFAATRVLSSMLYGVDALDAMTMGVAAAVLGGIAGLACFIPARRLTNVDPMIVLRS